MKKLEICYNLFKGEAKRTTILHGVKECQEELIKEHKSGFFSLGWGVWLKVRSNETTAEFIYRQNIRIILECFHS
jgi:hypothetical protein